MSTPLSRAELLASDEMARICEAMTDDLERFMPCTRTRARTASHIVAGALLRLPADLRRHLGEILTATADRGTST